MKKLNSVGVLMLALIVAGLCSTAYAEPNPPAQKPGASASTPGHHLFKKHRKKPTTVTGLPTGSTGSKPN